MSNLTAREQNKFMKTALGIFFLTFLACAQQGGRGQPPRPVADVQAAPQKPVTITLALSAELATALETARLNTRAAPVADPATGVVTQSPVYPTLQAFLEGLLRAKGGLLDQVLTRYPPASMKAQADAVKKAQTDADSAAAAALSKP